MSFLHIDEPVVPNMVNHLLAEKLPSRGAVGTPYPRPLSSRNCPRRLVLAVPLLAGLVLISTNLSIPVSTCLLTVPLDDCFLLMVLQQLAVATAEMEMAQPCPDSVGNNAMGSMPPYRMVAYPPMAECCRRWSTKQRAHRVMSPPCVVVRHRTHTQFVQEPQSRCWPQFLVSGLAPHGVPWAKSS